MQFEKQFSTVVAAYCHGVYRKFHVYAGFILAKTVRAVCRTVAKKPFNVPLMRLPDEQCSLTTSLAVRKSSRCW